MDWLNGGCFVEIVLLVGIRLDSRLRGNDEGWTGSEEVDWLNGGCFVEIVLLVGIRSEEHTSELQSH